MSWKITPKRAVQKMGSTSMRAIFILSRKPTITDNISIQDGSKLTRKYGFHLKIGSLDAGS